MAHDNPMTQDTLPTVDLPISRDDPEVARDLVERLVPDSLVRRYTLSLVADSIVRANAVSPASWGITLHLHELRLNVGPIECLVLRKDVLRLTVDRAAVDHDRWRQIEQHPLFTFKWDGKPFQQIPTAYGVEFSLSEIADLFPLLTEPHAALIDKAAKLVKTRTRYFHTHSPGVVAYLEQELSTELPTPVYGLAEGETAHVWLFQANPRVWDLANESKSVSVGMEDDWSVSRYRDEMQPGDTMLLWQGGTKAGIYAVAELTELPFERPTGDFWPDKEQRPPTEWAVPFRYTLVLKEPISKASLQVHPILRDLQVLRAPQGTNFKVTAEQWTALQGELGPSDPKKRSRVWIEKTNVRGRPDREEGEYALGKALLSSTRASNGGDIYRFMRDVQPGDVILHLTDNTGFTGISVVASSFEEFASLPHAGREGESYMVRLRDFVPVEPPLNRDTFFSSPYRERLVALLDAGAKNLFYNREPNLNQGAFLTPAPPALIDILNDAYRATAGHDLPIPEFDNPPPRPLPHPPTIEDLAAATFLDIAELEEIESLLEEKKQLVFEGPPGSGKTFVAKLFARYVTGNALDSNQPPDERVELVQFHQSYGYEDFVQGIRPVTDGEGRLQYHVLPGTFMRLCDLASRNPERKFVLIIDEINRGNLSRIFGELLLLLEYRNERVRLPYGAVDGTSDQAFLVIPENLYLIGTMNSTDRSLALIDYALRRRFYFYAFRPVTDDRASVLERWLADQDMPDTDRQRVGRLFVELNRKVQQDLSADFQVGHSYFMTRDIGTAAGLDRVWRRAVRPLLAEYFHNQRDPEAALAGFEPGQLLSEDGVMVSDIVPL